MSRLVDRAAQRADFCDEIPLPPGCLRPADKALDLSLEPRSLGLGQWPSHGDRAGHVEERAMSGRGEVEPGEVLDQPPRYPVSPELHRYRIVHQRRRPYSDGDCSRHAFQAGRLKRRDGDTHQERTAIRNVRTGRHHRRGQAQRQFPNGPARRQVHNDRGILDRTGNCAGQRSPPVCDRRRIVVRSHHIEQVVRWWRLALLVLAGVVVAAAGTVLAVAVNVATGGTARWFPAMQRHPLWWTAGATAAVAAVAAGSLLAWGAQRWYDRGLSVPVPVPAVQRPEPWVVDRPGEVGQVVAALRRRGGTVGITTAVHGAGGSAKRRWRRWCGRTGGCCAGSGAGCTG